MTSERSTNRGAIALEQKLSVRGAKAQFARDMGIDPTLVSNWLSGVRRPDTVQRARVEDDHGVVWRWWDEEVAHDAVATVKAEIAKVFEEAAAEPGPTFRDPPAPTGTHGVG